MLYINKEIRNNKKFVWQNLILKIKLLLVGK